MPSETGDSGKEAGPGVTDPDPDQMFELATDDTARCILSAASEEPKSMRSLADRCGVSVSTVYRQVERLRNHGLVEADLRISAGGDHHEVFKTTIKQICLEFDSGLTVDVRIDRDFIDKFAALWEELEQSGASFGWRSADS